MLKGDREKEMLHFGWGLKCDKEGSIPCFGAWWREVPNLMQFTWKMVQNIPEYYKTFCIQSVGINQYTLKE